MKKYLVRWFGPHEPNNNVIFPGTWLERSPSGMWSLMSTLDPSKRTFFFPNDDGGRYGDVERVA